MARRSDRSFEYKLVVVVRGDLEMSGGKLAVQVSHAAVSCTLEAKTKKPQWFAAWYREGQRKVVVRVEGLEELRELDAKAARAGLPRAMITDAGLTELPPETTTCLGIGPAPSGSIDPITGSLPLV